MIIGLIGFKQVGKSTAAKYLEEKYGFVRHNMKDALIAEIKQNFPDLLEEIQRQYIDWEFEGMEDGEILTVGSLFKYKPPLMRALLQNYGTEVRRGDNDNYWTGQWWDTVMHYPKGEVRQGLQPKYSVVTDDVRFLNEAKVVKDADGILIRLTRPDITTGGSHASETEQLEIEADYTIEAVPGDHEHLKRKLDEIMTIEIAKL